MRDRVNPERDEKIFGKSFLLLKILARITYDLYKIGLRI